MKLTPAQLFFGRAIKTRLPISGKLLQRENISEEIVQNKIKEKRVKQKYYYDKNARALPVLSMGDLVIFKKTSKEWIYGRIIGIVNDRSYLIKDNFDNVFRRNRRFIAKTKNNNLDMSEMLYEENIRHNVMQNVPETLEEIQIIPPCVRTHQENMNQSNETNCEVDESELPAYVSEPDSSDEYQTASSSDSEAELVCNNEPVVDGNNANNSNSNYNDNQRRTHSSRAVKPPQRYGWD